MHPYARLLAALATAALAACSASKPASAPPSTLFEAAKSWVSPEGRRHPLAGRVYDVAAGTMTSTSAVVDAAAGADFVLLGEQHDNVDHHRLQNALLRELLAWAAESGWPEVSLHAQLGALGFYEKHGFAAYGPEYDEAGIRHRSMRLELIRP